MIASKVRLTKKRNNLCKAIHYVLSAWKEFTAFKDDTRLPLSNNSAERALRQAVLGRKNFNGSKTINGADAAATLYTIIESCKKAELDPIDYLKYIIQEDSRDRRPETPIALARLRRGILDEQENENKNHGQAVLRA